MQGLIRGFCTKNYFHFYNDPGAGFFHVNFTSAVVQGIDAKLSTITFNLETLPMPMPTTKQTTPLFEPNVRYANIPGAVLF